MSDLPEKQLILMAGPNGAGKSLYSHKFSDEDSVVYNPHQESLKIQEKYKGLSIESQFYFIENHFQNMVDNAIKLNKDFVLESNFRDSYLMNTVDKFRYKGYSVNLIYFLLSSEKESMHRVNSRVAKGGHVEDPQVINASYREGLTNLQDYANQFDRLLVLDATRRIGEQQPLLNLEGRSVKFIHPDIPQWAMPIMRSLTYGVHWDQVPRPEHDPPFLSWHL